MSKTKILYISQEINPFLPETELSKNARQIPQHIQSKGKEVRVFMPRYANINERRHQLHEVIRLSGMNIIIDENDHPLLIKVASIPQARLQVYFIDNEDYFKEKAILHTREGEMLPDNDEKAMFFARGVLETVKKLGWKPDVIHCQGWISSLVPLYIKKMYHEDAHFQGAKMVYSAYEYENDVLSQRLFDKLLMDGFTAEDVAEVKEATVQNIQKVGVKFSNAFLNFSEDTKLSEYCDEQNVLNADFSEEEDVIKAYSELYDSLVDNSVTVD